MLPVCSCAIPQALHPWRRWRPKALNCSGALRVPLMRWTVNIASHDFNIGRRAMFQNITYLRQKGKQCQQHSQFGSKVSTHRHAWLLQWKKRRSPSISKDARLHKRACLAKDGARVIVRTPPHDSLSPDWILPARRPHHVWRLSQLEGMHHSQRKVKQTSKK